MNHNNSSQKMIPSIANMDITAKFSSAIIIGLVLLFSLASVFIIRQQTSAMNNMMSVSKDIETKTMESQTAAAKLTVKNNAEHLANLLTHTTPRPMSEFDLITLQNYAKVVMEDTQISYVAFLTPQGKPFAEAGDKESIDPNNLITSTVTAEGVKLGELKLAYNFNDFEKQIDALKEKNQHNLETMRTAKNQALSDTKISFGVIIVLMALCITGMIYFMFKAIVINRLSALENRLKDIAEGEGDLTQRVLVEGKDAIDRVGLHFNGFLDTVHNTVKQVAMAVGQLSACSQEIGEMTSKNQQDIEQQKQQVDMAATAVTEMSASIREVSQHASLAAESAQQADSEAKNGNHVVNDTIQAINTLAGVVDEATTAIHRVDADSVSIGTILDVIRGIAEQTNLLALNAAIEAARAGEQGRGFAVVADEVRTLAQRTQESTQEIQEMIEKLQKGTSDAVGAMERGRNQVQSSVDIAGKAGESLRVITGSVTQIMDMNTQIANAAEEQYSVSEDFNKNIVSISTVTEKTATVAIQTFASSQQLSSLSQNLQALVANFKV